MTAPSPVLLWAAAATEAGLPVAHSHNTYGACTAEADASMRSGLIGGLNLYASLDDGAHWHLAEHRDPPPPTGLAADLAAIGGSDIEYPAPVPAHAGGVSEDWAGGGGRLAAGLVLGCVVVGCALAVLAAGYCGWMLASSPACAAVLLVWPARRRALAGWSCWCGTYNSTLSGTCKGCGKGRS